MDAENWRPWLPRVLAPLAFFVAATILVLVVQRSLTADTRATPSEDTTPAVATTGARATQAGTTTRAAGAKKRYYRVREGEFLETIAQKFDTTVADLLQLNPGLDPNSLSVGQRIRVR